MGMKAMCKLNPDGLGCNLWHREMCGQCPKWYLNQDHGRIIRSGSKNPAYKMMTTDECQRLKRDLEISSCIPNGLSNSLIFIILVLFILMCISITIWMLAKAFIFKCPETEQNQGAGREAGGKSSVEQMVDQLRDKCNPSMQKIDTGSTKGDGSLFVPQNFWNKFPMIGNQRKDDNEDDDDEGTSDTSEESSESSESTESEETNENEVQKASTNSAETSGSTDEQSPQTTDDGEPTNDNCRPISRKSCDPLAEMPTYYGPSTICEKSNQNRAKIRWANWLKRSDPTDYQV